ncbi:signal transduction histidine kinase/CHASE3 domain sensor protein/ActR/RegA family two-component response regulator [Bradyrhizobium sp. CIR48]|uniref:CHASE3 domain-containing protein n=1 Tax=unclassified Bradyrhizobium TaxID=2631580 RepID=UPI0003605142|nr:MULTISPECIES: CHASE3 domain-containing protein [unclassified Bradyrhizobium]MBB4378350.1 signal transduction histidine kinase/CHASE3 domain sensor protein/ActR/RegA family two-component response regulator [Bradyrhizobium sp. SBR1B]MBB4422008.1 signal transduction histidine kinase/CHASE3 domain sensor protein/ActR/RegA family two-component response regulator [Bradyrhizobium sp. CIR48]SFN74853.1 PAS fold-containing protein [Bradyrhizobium sp. Rc3b]
MIPTQRVILGAGLAILLIITAASIALDVKSRSDAAWVNHTVQVQKKISDLRVLLRRAESAARGYELYRSQTLADEFQGVRVQIAPALAELKRGVRDNPDQVTLLEGTEPLALRRVEIAAEAMRLRAANDQAGIAALNSKAEGRGLMDTVMGNLDHLSADEERLLTARSQDSRRTGIVLLGIDVAGAVLILLLVALVMRESQRATVQLQSTLEQTQAAKHALEAAVAERTEHLVTAHDELRLSVNVLQSTFHSMAEAVLVIDAEGNVLLSNPAAERMLLHRAGMNLRNLRALSDVFHGDGVTPMKADELPSVRVLRGEKFEDLEMIVRPHSGNAPRHLMISGRPMLDGQGDITGAVLVYHDATMSRETERQLYQSQKLDAIGKLTGGVAHDFNNMLTVISGNTETLVASLKQQPELQRAARLIDDAAERCAELIQHLLAFARRQPLQPRNVEINAAIADIAKLLRPTLGEQIQIETVLEQGPMTAHIDPSRLTNAVLNMAINARDAMPNGGKLLLETHRVVLDEAYAQAHADVVAGPYVMLAVSDTGTGMSPDIQQKAFEPFFTTKEVGKGSGLGLSMVYGFVKQSGGHIKIYSEENHGTTIKLYLPPGEGAADVAAAAAPQVEGGAETIFVVEDDNLVRNFVTAQLESLGYKTVAAPDGKSALELIAAGQPFDLLFTDVVIPGGMSGRDLADEVAKLRPGVKVLYTSGYTDNAIVHHGKLDDGVMLLTKPYRRNQLAEMIRKALGGGTMTAS